MRALFQFVKRVKATGVNEQLWKENKQIDELKFKFKEKEDPATYARFVKTLEYVSEGWILITTFSAFYYIVRSVISVNRKRSSTLISSSQILTTCWFTIDKDTTTIDIVAVVEIQSAIV